MTARTTTALDRFASVDLTAMNETAALQTRRDRKYLIGETDLQPLLDGLDSSAGVLEIDGRRWSRYESTYLDTPDLVTYHLAARRRPDRFKVRTRRYADTGLSIGEVKVKDRRGRTVKHRSWLAGTGDDLDATVAVARDCATSARWAGSLRPALTTRYERAALLLPAERARVTVDCDVTAVDADGRGTGLGAQFVIETKTAGRPCAVDRLLWRAGIRPVRFSKYATAMAALHPDLPSNRWHRVLGRLQPVRPVKGAVR
jgi:hypothetical protein